MIRHRPPLAVAGRHVRTATSAPAALKPRSGAGGYRAAVNGGRSRIGRLFAGDEKYVITDEVMALTWASEPSLWDLINSRLDTLIGEYEEEDLTADQSVEAASVLRSFSSDLPSDIAASLQGAADFLDRQGHAGLGVQVAL